MKQLKRKFYRWKEMLRFKRARRRAIYMNNLSGKKHIVIKLSGTYHVFNRDLVKSAKKRGAFKKDLNWYALEQKALYVANQRQSIINQ